MHKSSATPESTATSAPRVLHVPCGTGADLVRAAADVRRLAAEEPGRDIEVRLADGTYRLGEPLVLTDADSGRGGGRITWTAEAGAGPVLSGGVRVTGWLPAGDGRWAATVPEHVDTPRALFVDGVRASWARSRPLSAEDCTVTADGLSGPVAARITAWSRPADVEAVFRVRWRNFHCRVAEASPELIVPVEPCWTNSGAGTGRTGPHWDDTCVTATRHARLAFLANAPELLHTPGHFVWNSKDRTVTYLPRPGEDLTRAEVVVAATEELLVLDGAHDVTVSGLTFAHTSWRQPESPDGYAGMQAGLTLTRHEGPGDLSGRHYTKPRAAVSVRRGRGVTVTGCRFAQLGGAGVALESGTRLSTVTRCRFTDLASGALYVGDLDPHPTPEAADQDNSITYNEISHCGVEFTDAVGIWAGYTRNLTISHNTLEHLPYSGISIGWGWNQPEAQDPWLGDNTVHANRITDVLQPHIGQFDGGAVYTQGQQAGTVVTGNYIDRSEYPATLTDGNGVYLDEQSSHITVTGNVVTRVGYKWVSNWAEYGVDNHAHGNWTDNADTPPLSGRGSTMTDNRTGLTELPPEAVAVAEQAGAGPWPAPVDRL